MRWLEHVERMNNIRMPKMILSAKVEGGRRRGRPRKRWLDDVECNTRSLGIRNWRLKARNRLEWRAVVGGSQSPLHRTVALEMMMMMGVCCVWR
jgi:hypothetical protein